MLIDSLAGGATDLHHHSPRGAVASLNDNANTDFPSRTRNAHEKTLAFFAREGHISDLAAISVVPATQANFLVRKIRNLDALQSRQCPLASAMTAATYDTAIIR
ncbi:hypothetical protein [Rhizobium etli]|uniref:hypothetical protein n=1 Tax=Rhizobium etli TaxID=29449 RepID=UPI00019098F7|nr:hypothetical protein [Rhizobium sp. IE4771]